MSANPMDSLERERLEMRANQIRSRLMRTVERLDVKRHDLAKLADVPYQIESHAVPIAATAALAMVAFGAVTTLAAVHAFTKPQRLRKERTNALKRAWEHPERVGQRRSSVLGGLGRTLLQGVATTLAFEALKHVMAIPAVAKQVRAKTRALEAHFDSTLARRARAPRGVV